MRCIDHQLVAACFWKYACLHPLWYTCHVVVLRLLHNACCALCSCRQHPCIVCRESVILELTLGIVAGSATGTIVSVGCVCVRESA